MIASVGRMMRKGGGGLSWPAGMKEHIKAWYDPKKQGMTNFDVIEAYTEDFKKWNNSPEKYTGSLTSNSLALTNVSQKTALIYSPIKPYDFKVLIRGLQEGQHVKFGFDYGELILEADKDGVYTLEWKEGLISYGIYTNFIGECNITITQLPTSILKDFSGNKHDAYLYGFKGKLNSGVGIYAQDFKNWSYGSSINNNISTKSYNKFHIVKKKADNWFGFTIGIPKTNYYNQSYKLKFTINKKIDDIKFNVVSTDGNLKTTNVYSVKINDGSIIDIPVISEEIFNNKEETNIYYDFGTNKDIEIDVELIADYPNQLCYDGKSYAVAYGLPILTDYTVMAERTWFENRNVFLAKGNITTEAKYAFIFERFKPDGVMTVQSFGAWNDVVSTTDSCISYLTKNKYNGIDIRSGIGADDDMLSIGGALNKGNIELTSVCCHGAIIVADRSFTEEEINWLKDNLFRK